MSDVISIFENSMLKEGNFDSEQKTRSNAVNNLLSIIPNIDKSELKFTIKDEYFQAKADEFEEQGKNTYPVISDTFGSATRKGLRKMIRKIDLREIIHPVPEFQFDEQSSRRQSEVFASKTQKTQFADASTLSRRGTKIKSSLQYNVKRKYSTKCQIITKPSTERRESCYKATRISGGRKMSTMTEGNNPKQHLKHGSTSKTNRSDSLISGRICSGVENSVGFALSPPLWGYNINLSAMKNGIWQKNEQTRRKVTSWLTQDMERITI